MLTSAYDHRQSHARPDQTQQDKFNEAVGPALRKTVEWMQKAYLSAGKYSELAGILETMLGDDFAMPDLEADAIHYTQDAWAIIEIYKEALGAWHARYGKEVA